MSAPRGIGKRWRQAKPDSLSGETLQNRLWIVHSPFDARAASRHLGQIRNAEQRIQAYGPVCTSCVGRTPSPTRGGRLPATDVARGRVFEALLAEPICETPGAVRSCSYAGAPGVCQIIGVGAYDYLSTIPPGRCGIRVPKALGRIGIL